MTPLDLDRACRYADQYVCAGDWYTDTHGATLFIADDGTFFRAAHMVGQLCDGFEHGIAFAGRNRAITPDESERIVAAHSGPACPESAEADGGP